MPTKLVVDSSTLIALERGGLIKFLDKIGYGIFIPPAVEEELKKGDSLDILQKVKVEQLAGRTIKKSKEFSFLGIGEGEAQCCALAANLGLDFIVCDDRKFIRQRFLCTDKRIKKIKILGFAFFLDIFYKRNLITDAWKHFFNIIGQCNWQRSVVQIANYTFLKELGY